MSFTIRAIASATPPHRITQGDAASLAVSFGNVPPGRQRSLEAMYQQTRIRTRGSVLLETPDAAGAVQHFFPAASGSDDAGPTTAVRMERYAKEAGGLAVAAARGALALSGIDAGRVTHLVTCSCTGFANPGVDLQIVADVGLSPTVARTHIGFMGCHGAFNSLRVAGAFAADPRSVVVVVAVELCSLHFQYGQRGDFVVSNAIFADGAAALVATGGETDGGWQVRRQWSSILPDSRDDMGWAIGDHGFQMTLSPRVAGVLEGGIRGLEEGFPEHAPAQSLGAHLDAIDRRGLQKRIHHHRAGQHDVRPVGLEAGNAPALTAGQGGHALDEVAQGVPRQQEPVYLAKGVRGRLLGHRGESAHGATHGHQPGGIRDPRVEAQHVEGMAAQGAHIIGRLQIGRHEGVGHPHGAEWLAHRVCEQPVLHPAHLDAAASELSDEASGWGRPCASGKRRAVA